MPAGLVIWAFLKPMLLGRILYAPYTPVTKAIMEKVWPLILKVSILRWSLKQSASKFTLVGSDIFLAYILFTFGFLKLLTILNFCPVYV